MQVFLALSCLQGRPLQDACEELAVLGDGLQLTPGCAPTVGFEAWLSKAGIVTRTHHGFTPLAYRASVWGEGAQLRGHWDSVHPPRGASLDALLSRADLPCLEVMYPGEMLGEGAAVEAAMEAGIRLAVDVSHVFIQRQQRAMTDRTWKRLQAYDRISEIHVSANDGRRDRHQPISKDTFGLDWARSRAHEGAPIIVEAYLHLLSQDQRRAQVDFVREG